MTTETERKRRPIRDEALHESNNHPIERLVHEIASYHATVTKPSLRDRVVRSIGKELSNEFGAFDTRHRYGHVSFPAGKFDPETLPLGLRTSVEDIFGDDLEGITVEASCSLGNPFFTTWTKHYGISLNKGIGEDYKSLSILMEGAYGGVRFEKLEDSPNEYERNRLDVIAPQLIRFAKERFTTLTTPTQDLSR